MVVPIAFSAEILVKILIVGTLEHWNIGSLVADH